MSKALLLFPLFFLASIASASALTKLSNSELWDIYTTEQGRACINISYGKTDGALVATCQQYAQEISLSYSELVSKEGIYRYLSMLDHYGCIKAWQDSGAAGIYAQAINRTKKSRQCAGIWAKLNRLS